MKRGLATIVTHKNVREQNYRSNRLEIIKLQIITYLALIAVVVMLISSIVIWIN